MRKINDWENVKEAEDFARVQPGGYVCRICNVEDVAKKEYLEIKYDIAEGEFTGYYQELFKAKSFWGGKLFRSYKETAASFFKSFITALEKSNPGFQWDWDEQKLIGKSIGIVLGEEEYIGKDGTVKTRLHTDAVRSVDAIRSGDYKVPPKKLLDPADKPENVDNIDDGFPSNDDDLPF